MKNMKKKLTTIFALLFLFMTILPVYTHANECNHQWNDWWASFEENCGNDGTYYRNCQLCNASETKIVPATGNHIWDEWDNFIEPSCLKEGSQRRFCTVCYKDEYKPIPAIGHHTWSDWEIELEPSCGDTGYKTRECSVCYAIESEDIPETKIHLWEEWETTKRATALSPGKKSRFCSECYTEETQTIPQLKAKVSLKDTSITIEGNKSYTLKIKSKTYGDKVGKWSSSNKKIATVNENGKITGKKEGIAKITLEMKSGARATCKIKVTKPKTNNNASSKSNNKTNSQSNNNTGTKSSNNNTTPPPSSGYVWIPKTGKKYHKTSTCSGMKGPRKVTVKEAVNAGYEPCSRCY